VFGLVREHDYAVIDLKREDDGSRLLLIKNPWVDSLVWTGAGSSATLKAHTVGSTPPESSSNQFWMAFEDVLQHFDSLYVNWNPALFAHRQDHHFKWDMPDKTEELVFTTNPQFSVLSPSGSPVWVFLSRHWQDAELEILRQRKAEKEDRGDAPLATVSKQLGFMALALYAASPPGTRVPLPDSHARLHQCPYVDSPNTLLRYDPAPGVPQTLVVTQTELPLPTYSFTLSFFSHDPLTITPAPSPLPHNISVTGAWTRRTAGGSAAHPSYFTNPQYALTLPHASPLTCVLSTSARDLPVHVAVLFAPSGGGNHHHNSNNPQRVTAISGRDILCSSTEYHRGCTCASHPHLDAGTYIVLVSTYEPGHTAAFTLRLSSACPLTIKPLPASDAAGRLRTPLPGAFFATGQSRLHAPVGVSRLTRLSALARSTTTTTTAGSGGSSSALRVALERGTGPHRTVLAVSGEGEFADASMGLRTGEVDVEPEGMMGGGLWVVLERIGGGGGGGDGGVQVEVLSDAAVHLSHWEAADEE
jgi:hypothetical protein